MNTTFTANPSISSDAGAVRIAGRTLPRWLLVLGIVALTGVGIDLLSGRQASAIEHKALPAAQAGAFIDHSATALLEADPTGVAGASIGSYEVAIQSELNSTAMSDEDSGATDAQQTAASVGAYND